MGSMCRADHSKTAHEVAERREAEKVHMLDAKLLIEIDSMRKCRNIGNNDAELSAFYNIM